MQEKHKSCKPSLWPYAQNMAATTLRSIEGVYRPPPYHWVGDGFRVHGYFGAHPKLTNLLNPFLLMDYHPPYEYPPTTNTRRGVGPHPHRGFETVTLAFAGSVEHHDSAGNHGVIGPGDVQWMTAGRGILHKEYHAASYIKEGGPFHMMQLWVNLPAKEKMGKPHYQEIQTKDIVKIEAVGIEHHVIAGSVHGKTGPAQTATPIHLSRLKMQSGSTWKMEVNAHHSLGVLVMKGEVALDSTRTAQEKDLAMYALDGDGIEIVAQKDSEMILLGGEPILEPVVSHGPFVMNTREEIIQAVEDYQRGAFGLLAD